MPEFMEKMMAGRAVLKGEKTKEEVAKKMGVTAATVGDWARAVKKAALNEHLRMEAVKKEKPEKGTSKKPSIPKKAKLPEPVKAAAPAVNEEEVTTTIEDEPWDLI